MRVLTGKTGDNLIIIPIDLETLLQIQSMWKEKFIFLSIKKPKNLVFEQELSNIESDDKFTGFGGRFWFEKETKWVFWTFTESLFDKHQFLNFSKN